jgi:hypothetical protein
VKKLLSAFTGLVLLSTGKQRRRNRANRAGFMGIPTTTSGSFSGTLTPNDMQADALTAGRIYTKSDTSANSGERRASL